MRADGAVHEEADRYLARYEGEPGTQRTYAYLVVDHLRWLEREGLPLEKVTPRDLERYMGILGTEVRMPLGEPWWVGKRPYGKTTLVTGVGVEAVLPRISRCGPGSGARAPA